MENFNSFVSAAAAATSRGAAAGTPRISLVRSNSLLEQHPAVTSTTNEAQDEIRLAASSSSNRESVLISDPTVSSTTTAEEDEARLEADRLRHRNSNSRHHQRDDQRQNQPMSFLEVLRLVRNIYEQRARKNQILLNDVFDYLEQAHQNTQATTESDSQTHRLMYNIFKRRASSPVPSTSSRDFKTFRLTTPRSTLPPPPPLEPIRRRPTPSPSQFYINDSTTPPNISDVSINQYCVTQMSNSQSSTSDSSLPPPPPPQQQQQQTRSSVVVSSSLPPRPLPVVPSSKTNNNDDDEVEASTAALRSRPKSTRLGLFRKNGSSPVWYISARQKSSWPYGIKELHGRGFTLIHMWYDVARANSVGQRLEDQWPLVFKWDGWKRLLTLNENCPLIEDDQVVQYMNAVTGQRGQWLSLSPENTYEMPPTPLVTYADNAVAEAETRTATDTITVVDDDDDTKDKADDDCKLFEK
ncbi:hypothetical protein M8J76_008862 [Diaphorina citri]|nr:hypothetical protein M8J76_008862 [Diaphorina citri]